MITSPISGRAHHRLPGTGGRSHHRPRAPCEIRIGPLRAARELGPANSRGQSSYLRGGPRRLAVPPFTIDLKNLESCFEETTRDPLSADPSGPTQETGNAISSDPYRNFAKRLPARSKEMAGATRLGKNPSEIRVSRFPVF